MTPYRNPKNCMHHGCRNLVDRGRFCKAHKVNNQAFRNSKEWKALRKQVLEEEPYCRSGDCNKPSTEVDHIIQPRIETWLKDYDHVIVSPLMGLSQFEKFGERVIVDCHDYIGHQSEREEEIRQLAAKYGLSILDNPCAAIEEEEK